MRSDERPDVLADHFQNVQWGGKKTDAERDDHRKEKRFKNNLLYEDKANVRIGEYTLEALKKVVKIINNNKALGPDGIRGDLFKIMDDERPTLVLGIINKWKMDKTIPETLSKADVVTISKKGNVEEPSNYTCQKQIDRRPT